MKCRLWSLLATKVNRKTQPSLFDTSTTNFSIPLSSRPLCSLLPNMCSLHCIFLFLPPMQRDLPPHILSLLPLTFHFQLLSSAHPKLFTSASTFLLHIICGQIHSFFFWFLSHNQHPPPLSLLLLKPTIITAEGHRLNPNPIKSRQCSKMYSSSLLPVFLTIYRSAWYLREHSKLRICQRRNVTGIISWREKVTTIQCAIYKSIDQFSITINWSILVITISLRAVFWVMEELLYWREIGGFDGETRGIWFDKNEKEVTPRVTISNFGQEHIPKLCLLSCWSLKKGEWEAFAWSSIKDKHKLLIW